MNAYERVMSDMLIQALIMYLTVQMVKHLKEYLDRLKEEDNGGHPEKG